MDAADLDAVYGALANALARVGESQASLLLATLALDLISRESDPSVVTAAIARAERLIDPQGAAAPIDTR